MMVVMVVVKMVKEEENIVLVGCRDGGGKVIPVMEGKIRYRP